MIHPSIWTGWNAHPRPHTCLHCDRDFLPRHPTPPAPSQPSTCLPALCHACVLPWLALCPLPASTWSTPYPHAHTGSSLACACMPALAMPSYPVPHCTPSISLPSHSFFLPAYIDILHENYYLPFLCLLHLLPFFPSFPFSYSVTGMI